MANKIKEGFYVFVMQAGEFVQASIAFETTEKAQVYADNLAREADPYNDDIVIFKTIWIDSVPKT